MSCEISLALEVDESGSKILDGDGENDEEIHDGDPLETIDSES